MRLRFAVSTGLGFIIIFCFGCYEPKGEAPFTKVGPAAPLDISVVLTDTTSNIYIYDVTRIQYQTLSKGSVVNDLGSRLTIVLDDKQIFPDTSVPNTIVIDPKQLANGKHKLTFYLDQTNATASSLASSFGKENFYTKKEVTVTVDLTLPDPVSIRKFQIIDGVMSVVWNKPSKFNFNSYMIRRFVMSEGSTQWFEYGSPLSISKNAVSFRDSLYSGGAIQYRVDMRGPSGEKVGNLRDTTIAILNPKVERIAIDGIRVSWDKPALYGAMKNIDVTGPMGATRALNPESTSYEDQLPFGGASVSITITPKYNTLINSFNFSKSFDSSVSYEGLGQTFFQTVPLRFGSREIIPVISNVG